MFQRGRTGARAARGVWRTVGAIALTCGFVTAPATGRSELAWDALADTYLAQNGLADAERSTLTVEGVVAQRFVHGRFGLFEVHFPAAHLAQDAGKLKDSILALIDTQERWLDWTEPAIGKARDARKDLGTLRKWVVRWKTGSGQGLAKLRDAAGADLYDLADAPDKAREADERLAVFMTSGASIGVERVQPAMSRLALLPTRKAFVEFVAFCGSTAPELEEVFWNARMPDWTMAFVGDLQMVALEYSAQGRPQGVYDQGSAMNESSPTGMQQQIVQLAMNGLAEQFFGPRVPLTFAQGLAMNMVIDLYNEIGTRNDGDLRSDFTMPQERFVPGGASEGGNLPAIPAGSRWRELQGADRFVSVLKFAQEEGATHAERTARNRVDCFALRDDSGGKIHVVRAPILGSAAAATAAPPAEFLGDWFEFLRAYKACFMYWLQNEVNRKKSEKSFAAFLHRLADEKQAADFEVLFREMYDDVPLSGATADKTNLEGRFLIWISKQG